MNLRYRVTLLSEERLELEALVGGGKRSVRRIKRAQILLAASAGVSDDDIVGIAVVGTSTVYRTKKRFVEDGLEAALSEDKRPVLSANSQSRMRRCLLPRRARRPREGERVGR